MTGGLSNRGMRTGCVFSRGRAIVAFPDLAVAGAAGCGEDSGFAAFEGEGAPGCGEDSGFADFEREGAAGCGEDTGVADFEGAGAGAG
jgi:hypothetical protein